MMLEKMMTNGEKFRSLFGISASELWCMNGYALTDWLNEDYVARDIFITQRLNELSTVQLEIKSCDDAISRRDAIEAVSDYIFFDVYGGMKPVEKCETEAKSILCDIPTVEPKRNKGEWIIHENADYVPKYECPYCHTFNDDDYNFCTECGSDMRELVRSKSDRQNG